MAKPTPHRVTQAEFDADGGRGAFNLSKTAPVYVVDDAGKIRFVLSMGFYRDENDCLWCGETIESCDSLSDVDLCAGPEVRRLRIALTHIAFPDSEVACTCASTTSNAHGRACPVGIARAVLAVRKKRSGR